MLVGRNSEEFKDLKGVIDWRHVEGISTVPAVLIFR